MRIASCTIALVVATLLIVACQSSGSSDPRERAMNSLSEIAKSVVDRYLASADELNRLLMGVQDAASAQAALPKVEAAAAQLRDAVGQLHRLSGAEIEAARQAYGSQLQVRLVAFRSESDRLTGKSELGKTLTPTYRPLLTKVKLFT